MHHSRNVFAYPRAVSFLLLSLFAVFALPLASAAADSQIEAAVADLERFERQADSANLDNPSTVRRMLNLLKLTRQRLESSTNKGDPSWIAAERRLEALVARLTSGPGPARPTESVPASVAPPRAKASAGASQMISQQRVRIQKLIRDIESASEGLDQGGVAPFQDPSYVDKQVERGQRFREALAKYQSFEGDSDVAAAKEALGVYTNMIQFGRDYAAKQTQALGDVQARLRAIDDAVGSVPETPQYPYEGNELGEWLVALATTREAAAQSLQALAQIAPTAHLPNNPGTVQQGAPYDKNDVNRLDHALRRNVSEIDAALAKFQTDLDLQVSHVVDTVEYFEALDPTDPMEQASAFLSEGVASQNWKRLVAARQLVAAAVGFDRGLQRPIEAEHQRMLERVEEAMRGFKEDHAEALRTVRMPAPASEDTQLLDIAQQTLSRPEYEVGPVLRTVVNAGLRELEKETSETQYDDLDVSLSGTVTLTGTKTTYFYAWKEFQVATAEQVGDAHFIFYTTLKRFTKGAPTTPVNKWIIANRFKSVQIPEQNIALD